MVGWREGETGKEEKNTGVYIAQIFKKYTHIANKTKGKVRKIYIMKSKFD